MKVVGKFIKWVFIGVGTLVVLGIIMAIAGGGDNTSTQPTNKEKPAVAQPQAPKQSTGISKEKYDQIVSGDMVTGEGGTPAEELLTLLGKPTSTTESNLNGKVMKTYSWIKLGTGTIVVTTTNDLVVDKIWSE